MFGKGTTSPQMSEPQLREELHSPDETRAAGRRFAGLLAPGDVVLLNGPLGAGKTVFAGGVAAKFGATNWRGSPTFALVHEYDTSPPLYHTDLYRLSEGEIEGLGLEEYAHEGAILLCEWAERAEPYLRSLAVHRVFSVDLEYAGEHTRVITVQQSSPYVRP
jgi:tRNA threonylcarbamoyladenosine biosynthesis protein TsaE